MNSQSRSRVKFLMADVTLEVLRFLMLNKDLLIVELSIAVPLGRVVECREGIEKKRNDELV